MGAAVELLGSHVLNLSGREMLCEQFVSILKDLSAHRK